MFRTSWRVLGRASLARSFRRRGRLPGLLELIARAFGRRDLKVVRLLSVSFVSDSKHVNVRVSGLHEERKGFWRKFKGGGKDSYGAEWGGGCGERGT